MVGERYFQLVDKLDNCLNCDGPVTYKTRVSDHCYPQLMIKKPEGRLDCGTTPLRKAVLRQYNKFTFCEECGPKLDYQKIGVFADSKFQDVRPAELVRFLRSAYPMSRNDGLFVHQVYNLVRSNDQMLKAIAELPGSSMDPDLIDKYLEASEEVEKFTKALLNRQIARILDVRVKAITPQPSDRFAYLAGR